MRWIPLVVVAVLVHAAGAAAKPSPAAHKSVAEGRVLYSRYCSSCHGVEADGHGPVASVLTHVPSDLRHLGDRFGKPLGADRLARRIDGREEMAAHGPRDMPVWGERFRVIEGGVDPRIRTIVSWLETIQQP
jgi:mono/diheme cytochrome c family protein